MKKFNKSLLVISIIYLFIETLLFVYNSFISDFSDFKLIYLIKFALVVTIVILLINPNKVKMQISVVPVVLLLLYYIWAIILPNSYSGSYSYLISRFMSIINVISIFVISIYYIILVFSKKLIYNKVSSIIMLLLYLPVFISRLGVMVFQVLYYHEIFNTFNLDFIIFISNFFHGYLALMALSTLNYRLMLNNLKNN